MFKRILSFVLVVLMACGVFTLSVSAGGSLSEEELLIQEMKDAYAEKWLKDYAGSGEVEYFDGNLQYFCYLGEAGYHVFQAAAVPGSPVEPTDIIGDYRFTAFMCMSYCESNPSGTYAYKDGELMPLKEAYNKGLVDLDLLYEKTDVTYIMAPLSDEELLENKCRGAFLKEFGIAPEVEEEIYVEFAAKFDNYTVFRATVGGSPELITYDYIGGYWFWAGAIYGKEDYNPTGLYTLDNYGNIESLQETVDKRFIDMNDVFPLLSEKCEVYLAGDIDSDKCLTVKDATLIQKYLANVPQALDVVHSHSLGTKVMDADFSGGDQLFGYEPSVNIKDATYIQKKVAKIIISRSLHMML